jgi:hypothetical protein
MVSARRCCNWMFQNKIFQWIFTAAFASVKINGNRKFDFLLTTCSEEARWVNVQRIEISGSAFLQT